MHGILIFSRIKPVLIKILADGTTTATTKAGETSDAEFKRLRGIEPTALSGKSPETKTVTPATRPEENPAKYYSMTMGELRNHCNRRGLGISGTKYNIIDRLKNYDAEQRRKQQREEEQAAITIDDDGSGYMVASQKTPPAAPKSSYGQPAMVGSKANTSPASSGMSVAAAKQTPAQEWSSTSSKTSTATEATNDKRFVGEFS